jgi:hypothetical protein
VVIAIDWSASTPATVLLAPLFFVATGAVIAFAGDRSAKESDDSPDQGGEKTPSHADPVRILWVIAGFIVAEIGCEGVARLPAPIPWDDPWTWSLAAYGFGCCVLLVYCLRVISRLHRAGEAVVGDASRVVISSDRLATGLLACGLALLEPEFLVSGWIQGGKAWGAAFAAAALLFLTAGKLKASPPTVIDEVGIACPGQWLGLIRWQDLDDIPVDYITPAATRGWRVPCLTFWFREGVSTPRRTYLQKNLDRKLGLGGFMVMPMPIGLSLRAAVRGFKLRLERYRATHSDEATPAP